MQLDVKVLLLKREEFSSYVDVWRSALGQGCSSFSLSSFDFNTILNVSHRGEERLQEM